MNVTVNDVPTAVCPKCCYRCIIHFDGDAGLEASSFQPKVQPASTSVKANYLHYDRVQGRGLAIKIVPRFGTISSLTRLSRLIQQSSNRKWAHLVTSCGLSADQAEKPFPVTLAWNPPAGSNLPTVFL
jgi:hypothetical protein